MRSYPQLHSARSRSPAGSIGTHAESPGDPNAAAACAGPPAARAGEARVIARDSMAHSPKHQQGKRACGSGAQRRWRSGGAARMPPSGGMAAAAAARRQCCGRARAQSHRTCDDVMSGAGKPAVPRIGIPMPNPHPNAMPGNLATGSGPVYRHMTKKHERSKERRRAFKKHQVRLPACRESHVAGVHRGSCNCCCRARARAAH